MCCLYPFSLFTWRLLVEVGLLQCFRWLIPLWRILRTTRRWPVYCYLIFFSKMIICIPHIEVFNLSIHCLTSTYSRLWFLYPDLKTVIILYSSFENCVFTQNNPNMEFTILCAQITLLYANVSPDDILLKQKLDALQANHPNLKVESSLISSIAYFTSIHYSY